jgi:energy-converting hydrogenase Eha subunit E
MDQDAREVGYAGNVSAIIGQEHSTTCQTMVNIRLPAIGTSLRVAGFLPFGRV